MANRKENSSIFLNFHDMRGQKGEEIQSLVERAVDSIPEGDRVVLTISREEYGKITIPLDLAVGEVIS